MTFRQLVVSAVEEANLERLQVAGGKQNSPTHTYRRHWRLCVGLCESGEYVSVAPVPELIAVALVVAAVPLVLFTAASAVGPTYREAEG
jgi:hypothetical protein